MKSIADVFEVWESLPEMAEAVGESHWVVSKWKQRKRIPPDAWQAVVDAVERKGKKLTADDLVAMHATPRRSGGGALACK